MKVHQLPIPYTQEIAQRLVTEAENHMQIVSGFCATDPKNWKWFREAAQRRTLAYEAMKKFI